jgi:hypothetical protein
LQTRLILKAIQRGIPDAIELRSNGESELSETRYRVDLPGTQLLTLNPADAGNEREMIIISATLVTDRKSIANITELYRLGVCFFRSS